MAASTTLLDQTMDSQPKRLSLFVVAPDSVSNWPLPEAGTLVIGRGETVDVHLNDPMASRMHARLHVGFGGRFEIEDMDSANGTRLRGANIAASQKAILAAGEAFTIGSTMLVVQENLDLSRPRRVWPHGHFEARLEEECARAGRSRTLFAAVRVHVESDPGPAAVMEMVASALRASDVLAIYGPGEYEILMPDTVPDLAHALAENLLVRLGSQKLNAQFGMASFPRDGQTPERLLALACERVRGFGAADEDGGAVVVEDPAMQRLYQVAERAAAANINILIVGETGVGKEVLAQAVHRQSPRAHAPILCLNCAALSESLLESELFGHERGAFTGAVDAKPGLLETAPGGTVFLDEMGEMPLALQAKLLRVIESREVTRVGGLKARPIDVRFVAATNRQIEIEVAAGRFRSDLYFRLNGITLHIPPLRSRPREIMPLSRKFLAQFWTQMGRRSVPRLSPSAEDLLMGYAWPGNVRELRNVIERAAVLCTTDDITDDHMPADTMRANAVARRTPMVAMPAVDAAPPRSTVTYGMAALQPAAVLPQPPVAAGAITPAGRPADLLSAPLSAAGGTRAERERILNALNECAGNQSRAAKFLGISRSTLIQKILLYGLPRPRKRAEDSEE